MSLHPLLSKSAGVCTAVLQKMVVNLNEHAIGITRLGCDRRVCVYDIMPSGCSVRDMPIILLSTPLSLSLSLFLSLCV